MMHADFKLFSRQLVRNPRAVSAIAPSSPELCRLMTAQIPHCATRVAEFGPGTGNITREILRLGVAPEDLVLFEINEAFCRDLRGRFPGVTVHNRAAQELATCGPAGQFDAVVSGLPLLSMPADVQEAILSAAFARLAPDGVYIQFTYGTCSPVRSAIMRRLKLGFTRTGRVWRNLPPATVYVYRKVRVAAAAGERPVLVEA